MPIPSEDSKVAPFTKEIKTIYNPNDNKDPKRIPSFMYFLC